MEDIIRNPLALNDDALGENYEENPIAPMLRSFGFNIPKNAIITAVEVKYSEISTA